MQIETKFVVQAKGGLWVKLMCQSFGTMCRIAWQPVPIATVSSGARLETAVPDIVTTRVGIVELLWSSIQVSTWSTSASMSPPRDTVIEPLAASQTPVVPLIVEDPLLMLKLLLSNVVSMPMMPLTVKAWFCTQAV